jgi:hypothetical protein
MRSVEEMRWRRVKRLNKRHKPQQVTVRRYRVIYDPRSDLNAPVIDTLTFSE